MRHTIMITLDAKGNPVPISADGKSSELVLQVEHNDEIRFLSHEGTVDVEFQGATPFDAKQIQGDGHFRVVLAEKGKFHYKCTLTTPDERKHGWPDNPNGGGTVEVGGGRSNP